MTPKPPPTRRAFADPRDELDYLYHKLLYWFYERGDARKARPFAERLRRLLRVASPGNNAIFGEECRSLIDEVKGDRRSAIAHRENEIRLIRQLHDKARHTPHQ